MHRREANGSGSGLVVFVQLMITVSEDIERSDVLSRIAETALCEHCAVDEVRDWTSRMPKEERGLSVCDSGELVDSLYAARNG